jgi:hypothetical protein
MKTFLFLWKATPEKRFGWLFDIIIKISKI